MPITWDKLDQRQQAYMEVIFTLDQGEKADHDDYPRWNYSYDRRPASKWQQIAYEDLLQEIGKRPRGEDVEQMLAGLVREGLIEREEHQGLPPDHPRVRIMPAGRRMVRDALGIKREQFTEAQRHLINRIVSAGLAPLVEVESAFRRGQEGREQIGAWKKMLGEQVSAEFRERLQKEQEYMASLIRFEPCAYPGCKVQIEVRTIRLGGRVGNEETPEPVRFMQLVEQMPGWHIERREGIKVLVPNTRTTELHLYACSPAHTEGVYRLTGQIILSLDQAEEQRLRSVVFPWTSEEAQKAIWLRAKSDALDYAAQAPLDATFPSAKAWGQINTIGRTCLAAFQESTLTEPANAGKQFTDDEEALTKRYLDMFRLEFKSGLSVREAILSPKQGGFHTTFDHPRWRALCDAQEAKQGEPEEQN